MTIPSIFTYCFAVGFALTVSGVTSAFAGDVLSPAHCKIQQDFTQAHSQSDDRAWDMYTVAAIDFHAVNDTLTVSATFNFSKCAELGAHVYGWKLFNESRKTTEVLLVGEEIGWFGVSHIHTSSPGEINASTGHGNSSFTFDEFLSSSQKSAWSKHETIRDVQLVIVADQSHSVSAGYTGSNGISFEGLRLSFDLVATASGYKAVRK